MFDSTLLVNRPHARRARPAPGASTLSVPFDISRSIGSDEREKNPIDDLFDVLRRQRLLQEHELMAREVERQRR
jgi:hypothetical protein